MNFVKNLSKRLIFYDLLENLINDFNLVENKRPGYKFGRQVSSLAMNFMRSAVRFKADVALGTYVYMGYQEQELSYVAIGISLFTFVYCLDYFIGDVWYPKGRKRLEHMLLGDDHPDLN